MGDGPKPMRAAPPRDMVADVCTLAASAGAGCETRMLEAIMLSCVHAMQTGVRICGSDVAKSREVFRWEEGR